MDVWNIHTEKKVGLKMAKAATIQGPVIAAHKNLLLGVKILGQYRRVNQCCREVHHKCSLAQSKSTSDAVQFTIDQCIRKVWTEQDAADIQVQLIYSSYIQVQPSAQNQCFRSFPVTRNLSLPTILLHTQKFSSLTWLNKEVGTLGQWWLKLAFNL